MRRIRTLFMLVALVSGVFAGSTTVVDAGTSVAAAPAGHTASADGKRWLLR